LLKVEFTKLALAPGALYTAPPFWAEFARKVELLTMRLPLL
jgi:hypothetical protein